MRRPSSPASRFPSPRSHAGLAEWRPRPSRQGPSRAEENKAIGGGLLRQSLRGKYTTPNFAIPHTAPLASTTNTIELRIEFRPGAGPSHRSFIYDYINLEAPSVAADGNWKLTTESGGSVILAQASAAATSSIALHAYNSNNAYHRWELENLGEDSSGRELVRL